MSAPPLSLTPDTQRAFTALTEACAARGLRFGTISTLRTCDEQNAIYAQGRTSPGSIVTQARGCMSFHTLARAIDIAPLDANGSPTSNPAAYEAIAAVAEPMGWTWGGRFPGFVDMPHFHWSGGRKMDEFCPDPTDCEAALARSMAMNIPVGGGSTWDYVAAAVGVVVGVLGVAWVASDG